MFGVKLWNVTNSPLTFRTFDSEQVGGAGSRRSFLRLPETLLDGVGVDAERDRRVGVAKPLPDRHRFEPSGNRLGRGKVAERVQVGIDARF